jgi:hypothetical protein
MRDLILRAAAPSIFGRTMCQPVQSSCARVKYGSSPNSSDQMPQVNGGNDSNKAWLITSDLLLLRPYRAS